MSDSPRKPFGHGKSQPASRPAAAKAPPKAQPAFEVVEDESDDGGFEVVDETPKKAMPVPKKPVRAEKKSDDFEVVEGEPAPKPKKKKPKRKLDDLSKQLLAKQEEDDARRAESLKHFEWTVPTVLLVIGIALSTAGAIGASKGVSAGYTLMVLCVFVAVYVPLAIGALMVVGLVMGINYGRLGPAILKMSAITFLVNGVWLLGDCFKAPVFLIAPISCFISYGIFMTIFDLDTSETGSSTGILNIMTFVANIILIGFIVVAEAGSSGKGGSSEPDDDDPPTERKERNRDRDRNKLNPGKSNPPPIMPDDDDSDDN